MYRAPMLCKYCRMSDKEIYQPIVPRAERELPVRGANYNVYEWGDPDAPLLMYLHGWADTGSTFQFVVDELTAEWHVVALDWRGFGRSSCECTSYWFPDYLADLHALLEIYSPSDPVRLVGHSMGANVASLYAGTMPERVRALVNIEGFGLADSDPADAPQRYRAWLEAAATGTSFSEYADFGALAFRIKKRHPEMAESQAAFVAREWAKAESDGVVRLRADPRHKLPNPVLYRRAEAQACGRAISAEILLVTGSGSAFAREFGDAATLLFPGCTTVGIEGAGHMIHFEAPHALATVIEDFLL
jgi:pimeloyl-ACP methyl ester carboxylesterase